MFDSFDFWKLGGSKLLLRGERRSEEDLIREDLVVSLLAGMQGAFQVT